MCGRRGDVLFPSNVLKGLTFHPGMERLGLEGADELWRGGMKGDLRGWCSNRSRGGVGDQLCALVLQLQWECSSWDFGQSIRA